LAIKSQDYTGSNFSSNNCVLASLKLWKIHNS
jgi:hypothetical protein